MPKNAFFGLFFQNFACGAENLAKIGTKQCFGRAREINLVHLKKKVDKIFEKILDPPLFLYLLVFFLPKGLTFSLYDSVLLDCQAFRNIITLLLESGEA